MPLRMIDWECVACGARKEELTVVSSSDVAIAPRHCGQPAKRIIGAPAIRTNDNAPRDMRTTTTAGHPVAGSTVHGRDVWDAQLGKETAGMSGREIERYAKARGLEIVPQSEYGANYLSQESPIPRLEDDPKLLRETEEDAADMYDRWEAGKLPEIATPLLDQDTEARENIPQQVADAAPVIVEEGA